MNDSSPSKPTRQPPDVTRRRLTKAALTTPAVLGVLSSRPILANELHHCTPSGYISGFASARPVDVIARCSELGQTPAYWAGEGPNGWPSPSEFVASNGQVRLFKESPDTFLDKFADAYEIVNTNNSNVERDANVWEVLAMEAKLPSGMAWMNRVVRAKAGYDTDLELGAEAVATLMNALAATSFDFPILPIHIVHMFNSVVVEGGMTEVALNATWDAAELKAYFQSLHG